jgi:sterol desaturase/sphingolipid hydroxylase (fatty acid hydroxylase superfamily)
MAADDSGRRPPRIFRALAFAAFVAGVLIAERRRPLRRRVEPGARRLGRNAAVSALAAGLVGATESLLIEPVVRLADRRRLGLVRRARAPRPVRLVAAFLLLDYALYWWHRFNHQSSRLWRFHAVHHADRDLDASTGLRFHFGEMALAALFKAAQVVVIGPEPAALRAWQSVLVASVVFHHSNLRLPPRLERRLAAVVVTPRMHGIHHSVAREETDSNYSSLLAWWDRLHRTVRLNVPQDAITIGVAALQHARDVTLPRLVVMPFAAQPDYWRFADGRPALPAQTSGRPGELAE